MDRRMNGGLLAALTSAAACLLLTVPAQAADAAGARAFLKAVYSHYPTPKGRRPYFPTGPSAPSVFDPAMVALLREDQRLAHGEVGAIDSDPFCQCQDDDGMTAAIESVRLTGPASAVADVAVRFGASSSPAADRVEFDLVALNGVWRIHDIRTKAVPSLRAYLAQANRARAHVRPR